MVGGRRSTSGRRRLGRSIVALAVGGTTVLALAPSARAVDVVSVEAVGVVPGAQGNGGSFPGDISADGRVVVFESAATNLVPGDTNGRQDVFARDTRTGITVRVSVSSGEFQANGGSTNPSVSADGRYVAFESDATNLVAGDTNGVHDVFVRDLLAGTTRRASVSSTGAQANVQSLDPVLSADGRYVAFMSFATNLVGGDTNANPDVFLRDLRVPATRLLSLGPGGVLGTGGSLEPAISDDGRYVAFVSAAPNLVPGDTNGVVDVFVRDVTAATTSRVSVTSAGGQLAQGSDLPAISGDGASVAFVSASADVVRGDTNRTSDVFVHQRSTGATVRASLSTLGAEPNASVLSPDLSRDGRYVTFRSAATNLVPGDTNAVADVFRRDLTERSTARVSLDSQGRQANGDTWYGVISPDGSTVGLGSRASNLVSGDTNAAADVFTRRTDTGVTVRVSESSVSQPVPTRVASPSLSDDGRFVAFDSAAADLVAGDAGTANDVFLRDMASFTVTRVSVSTAGAGGNDDSLGAQVDGDASRIVFSSSATNLVAGDTNGAEDVFLRDRGTSTTVRASIGAGGVQPNGAASGAGIDGTGTRVVFSSDATNLTAGDTNGRTDVFLRDLSAGSTRLISVAAAAGSGNGASRQPRISRDGRFVVFVSDASNLVAGDTNGVADVFVRDLALSTTTRVSLSATGAQANGGSSGATVSRDGKYVAFASDASNLVTGDTNGVTDVFVRDLGAGSTARVSVSAVGAQGNARSVFGVLSGDGRYVAIHSDASNLVPSDINGFPDIVLRDRTTGANTLVSVRSTGLQHRSWAIGGAISDDGRYVAVTAFDNLAPPDARTWAPGTFRMTLR